MTDLPERIRKNIEGIREVRAIHLGVTPTGCCRWCWNKVTEPRRRRWCSQACVDAFNELINARGIARARDQGICGICGIDTAIEQKLLDEIQGWQLTAQRLHYRATGKYLSVIDPKDIDYYRAAKRRIEQYAKQRPDLFTMDDSKEQLVLQPSELGVPRLKRLHAAEVDHIVPVESSGLSVVENLITLCNSCHHQKTAAEAASRAKLKRALKPKTEKKSRWLKSRPFPKRQKKEISKSCTSTSMS